MEPGVPAWATDLVVLLGIVVAAVLAACGGFGALRSERGETDGSDRNRPPMK